MPGSFLFRSFYSDAVQRRIQLSFGTIILVIFNGTNMRTALLIVKASKASWLIRFKFHALRRIILGKQGFTEFQFRRSRR